MKMKNDANVLAEREYAAEQTHRELSAQQIYQHITTSTKERLKTLTANDLSSILNELTQETSYTNVLFDNIVMQCQQYFKLNDKKSSQQLGDVFADFIWCVVTEQERYKLQD